jgi:DNA-binding NarL/FixJ family response regulator
MTRHALVVDGCGADARHVQEVLFRDGVSVAIAHSAEAALRAAEQRPPDLLVVELDLGARDGGILLAAAVKRRWGSSVVFLAGALHGPALAAIVSADATAIVSKPLDARHLWATLRFAMQRHHARAARAQAPVPAAAPPPGRMDGFTPREREVVALMLQHHRVPAIARQLGISAATVRNHLKSVFKETGTHSQQELLDWLRPAHSGHPTCEGGADYLLAPESGSPEESTCAATNASSGRRSPAS